MYLTMFNIRSDKINKKLEEKKQIMAIDEILERTSFWH